MKCYKGFDKDMKCRGFQFESGKEYTEEKADICNCGFHACESPLEVFCYYAPGYQSRYCEVDLDASDQTESDSKRVGKHIKIGAEIGIAGLVKAHLEYVNERIEKTKTNTGDRGASSNTGDRGASSNTGDCGASSNTGYRGASSNTGNCGASSNTGDRGASSNTGYYGASSNTGNCGASSNTGDCGASSNTGYRGASSNTGDYGVSSNTGNCGASSNTGYRGSSEAGHPNSVAVAWGPEGSAKGVIGSFLVFAEWESNGGHYWLEDTWTFKGAKMVQVDGERIKEDTYYKLVNGEFVEVENE